MTKKKKRKKNLWETFDGGYVKNICIKLFHGSHIGHNRVQSLNNVDGYF